MGVKFGVVNLGTDGKQGPSAAPARCRRVPGYNPARGGRDAVLQLPVERAPPPHRHPARTLAAFHEKPPKALKLSTGHAGARCHKRSPNGRVWPLLTVRREAKRLFSNTTLPAKYFNARRESVCVPLPFLPKRDGRPSEVPAPSGRWQGRESRQARSVPPAGPPGR